MSHSQVFIVENFRLTRLARPNTFTDMVT